MKIAKTHVVIDEVVFNKYDMELLKNIMATCAPRIKCAGCPFTDNNYDCMFNGLPHNWRLEKLPQEDKQEVKMIDEMIDEMIFEYKGCKYKFIKEKRERSCNGCALYKRDNYCEVSNVFNCFDNSLIVVPYDEQNDSDNVHKIAKHYGFNHQMEKLGEELAELQVEVMRYITDHNADRDKLANEIADVEIMIEQVKFLKGMRSKVEKARIFKINRQLERMGHEVEEV